MNKILSEDKEVQEKIKIKADKLWKYHLKYREIIKEKGKEKYIYDKAIEEFENKVYESLSEEGKENDAYRRFIKEKIETVYINKKVDDCTILKMSTLYPHYKKWFEDEYPRIPVPGYAHVRANFIHSDRLGKETAKDGWIGLTIKRK
jgi:hypothetical protein